MKRALRLLLPAELLLASLLLGACAGPPREGIQSNSRLAATAATVQNEAPGNYWIGRRYYKPVFKFWGYVRRPGQPWSTAQLVMLNENQKLAPDREIRQFGFDNGYEYKLYGDFTGDKVYEPASNGIYPEFMLKDYELISKNPPPIFRSEVNPRVKAALKPLTIERPE
jgi:hypothetical protein